jgi:RHS repeat-associated protein
MQRAVNNFDPLNNQDGVLITDGTGSASFFMGTCSVGQNNCAFSPPSGDFSTLTTLNGEFLRKYPDGTVVKISQTTGVMTAVIDRFGTSTVVSSAWSSQFQKYVPIQITDPEQQVIVFIYRDATLAGGVYKEGSIGAISVRQTRMSSFGVFPSGDLLHLVDPDGVWNSVLTYDAQHRLTQVSDRMGALWNYTYRYGKAIDYADAPTIQVDGGGSVRPRTTYREYLSDLYMAALAGGGTTQASAVPKGSALAQVIDFGNHTTQLALDRWNQPLSITDALNRTTTVTRDTIGRPTQVVSFTGATDVMKYSGRDLVMTRPAGADSTNYRWSTTTITVPGTTIPVNVTLLDSVWGLRQSWQQYVYAANTSIQSVKSRYAQGDPTLFTTQLTSDTHGRVLSATDNAGHVTRFFYNGRYGNRDSTVEAGGQYSKTIYDVFGRDSLSSASGLVVPPPDGPLQPVKTLYDALNRVVSVQEGWRTPVTVEYGPVWPTKVRDRAGQVFRRDYNALGWVTAEYDPADTTSWSRYVRYDYNVEGQLARRTNRRAQAIVTTYDAVHRPTSVMSPTSADYFGYSTDGLRSAAWNAISTDSSYFRADGWRDSVVTRIAGRRFRTRYLPDAYQRLDSIDINMGGSPITFVGRKYLYDSVQNVLKTIRFGTYFGATLSRNNEGMVTGITYLMANGGTRTRTLSLTSTHELFKDFIPSLWRSAQYPNTAYSQAIGYDSVGRIREETPVPEAALFVNTFAYKGARLDTHLRANTVLPSAVPWPSCPSPDANYGYNCAALVTAGKPYNQARYGVDAADNRVNDFRSGVDDNGASFSATTTYGFDPGDRVRTVSGPAPYGSGDNLAPFSGAALTFERDLDGNLTRRYGSSTDVRYGWDALGRLASATVAATGATVNYDYNAFGQLVRRRTNGTIDRHFLWQDDDLLAELDGTAGSRIAEYVHWGLDQPLAVLTGTYTLTEVNYVVQDARGNVKLLFNQLPEARVNFETEYTDWGTPTSTNLGVIPNRLLFKGMFYEGDSTKLYYARNRWYSPEFGGFMSEDPLSIGGGLNTYAFAGGDPINGSDPYGLARRFNGSGFVDVGPNPIFGFFTGDGRDGPVKGPSPDPSSLPDVHTDPFGPCYSIVCLPGFNTVAGGIIGSIVGGVVGCSAGVIAAAPTGEIAAPVLVPVGCAVGILEGASVGARAGFAVDVVVQMARAGKGRGGNTGPNEEANRIAKEVGLNRAGQRALHDEISRHGLSLEEIRRIAEGLFQQPKYRR